MDNIKDKRYFNNKNIKIMINDKKLYIDIKEICNIFKKGSVKELSQEEWEKLKLFKQKLTMSSSFSHKFCKQSRLI